MAASETTPPPTRKTPPRFRQVNVWLLMLVAIIAGAGGALAAASGQYFISPVRTVLYIALPFAIAVLCVLFILGSRGARLQLIAYGIAALAALFAAEYYIQAAGEVTTAEEANAWRNPPSKTLIPHVCPAGIMRHYRAGSRRAPVTIDGTAVLPVTGVSNNVLSVTRLSDGSVWRSDKYGFNNPTGAWSVEPHQAVMVVGDSFTFGAAVPPGRGFVDEMRRKLGKVINIGCGGSGPLIELASLVEFGPIAKPKLVVWAYYEGNDLTKNMDYEWQIPLLKRYLDPSFKQDLANKQAAIDTQLTRFLQARRARRATSASPGDHGVDWRSFASLTYLRTSLGLTYGYRIKWLRRFEQMLRRAKTVTESWGGRMIFVYLPGRNRYSAPLGSWDADGYKDAVLAVARRLGMKTIDIDDVFRQRPHPIKLFAGHYSIEGYRLVGQTIVDEIKRSTK